MTYYRIPTGTRVECYWNLHKDCFSVRVDGLVVTRTSTISLDNVTLAVQPAGRERVRRTGRKAVHAFVRGTWVDPADADGTPVTYNPYRDDTFVTRDARTPVFACTRLVGVTVDGKPQMFAQI